MFNDYLKILLYINYSYFLVFQLEYKLLMFLYCLQKTEFLNLL